jgi:peroxiredoxin
MLLLLTLLTLNAAPPVPQLADLDGTARRLAARPATVLVYLSCECPMSDAYLAPLNDLAARYGPCGVAVFGVSASPEETAAQWRRHAKEYGVRFPILLDHDRRLAALLGARVYPEAFVLDAAGAVRYAGRIDDTYTARLKPRTRTTRYDLVAALEEVLAGKPVTLARTAAFGCPLPGAARVEAAKPTTTYHRDVLPILQSACQSCHRPGEVGPFSLMTYAQAVKWADDLVGETKARRMPPWRPAQRGHFTNERTLAEAQIGTLERWVKEGMPEGDPKDAPKPVTFPEGWQLGKPDLVLEMPSEAVIGPTGRDAFHCVVLPTDQTEDRYIAAVEVLPGNRRVVHHTVQIIDTHGRGRRLLEAEKQKTRAARGDSGPGYWSRIGFGFIPDPSQGLGGWAPGLVPRKLPTGVGQRLPKGADIIMQVHYHRTGKEERDRTKIGLYFQKGEVKGHFQALPVPGLFLRVPAGDRAYKVNTSVTLTEDVTLHYVIPHMHLLGKKIELTAREPGGKEESVIRIDEWDYNWQEMYQLRTPRKLPKGTVLRVRAEFDNTADNPLNPFDPPRTVRFGEQTTNEMCFVFCGVHTAKPGFMKFTVNLLGW